MGGERKARPVAGARTSGRGLVLLMILAGGVAGANSVTVEGDAALGGPGFQLTVTLDNPASREPNDAWVGIGPDKGMAEETHVVGSFAIDVSALRLTPPSPSNPSHLCFLGLSETSDWATARVILFLQRGPDRAWLIGARVWDDDLASYVAVGPSLLVEGVATATRSPGQPDPGPAAMGVDFEWSVASSPGARDGVFRLFRTVGENRELVLENASLGNDTQKVSHMRAGVVNRAHHQRGTFGTLSLDEVGLARKFGPATP